MFPRGAEGPRERRKNTIDIYALFKLTNTFDHFPRAEQTTNFAQRAFSRRVNHLFDQLVTDHFAATCSCGRLHFKYFNVRIDNKLNL